MRTFLLTSLLPAALAGPLAAQPATPPTAPPLPPTVAARIVAVENGLLPNVPVQGQPGWNLLARMRYYRVPALSIAVVRNYRVEWVKAYGLADTTRRLPATPETLFSAGSISKLASAALALKLVEQHRLALDAPINTYLKSWQLADNDFTKNNPVTLRRLLSHTGGTSQAAYWGFVPGQPLPTVVETLSGQPVAECRPVVVNRAPGTGFQYSGGGYLVAQLALTDATGQDFNSLAERLLFRPLHMRGATFIQPLPPASQARAAWAYSENSWFKGIPYVYPQQAPAGLYTTPTDLARLLIELQNAYRGQGRVLTQASAQALLTPQAEVASGDYREQIGLGAFLLQRTDHHDAASQYFGHNGVNAGFVADVLGSVEGGNGVVVMTNANNGAPELIKEVRRAVAATYGWAGFLLPALRPANRPAAQLDEYAGRYRRGPDEAVLFRREGDHLVQRIGAGNDILVYPVGERGDTVAFTDFPLRATFERDAQGRVSGYRLLGATAPVPRMAATEFTPAEHLQAGRLSEAIAGYHTLHLGEYQLTAMAYELLNRHPTPDLGRAEALLQLAREQFPTSGIVAARWGDLYALRGEKTQAIAAYQAALRENPTDKDLLAKLARLAP